MEKSVGCGEKPTHKAAWFRRTDQLERRGPRVEGSPGCVRRSWMHQGPSGLYLRSVCVMEREKVDQGSVTPLKIERPPMMLVRPSEVNTDTSLFPIT